MDGYTVEEAASVLGVPRERVWELIARGILTGTTDLAGSMRVRLRAESPAPSPVTPVERPAEAAPSSADLGPFRELLTEFRSLTERYGQALLALGEARGEVAGLRSRVDMLEARVDVRVPSPAPISSSWEASPWPTPRERVDAPVAPAVEPADAAEEEPVHAAEAEADHGEESGSHRRRGRRRATESFADALARADDPSPPELPGAAETAAALAALWQEAPLSRPEDGTSHLDADTSLPRELPSAEPVPVADEDRAVDAVPAASSDTGFVEEAWVGATVAEPADAADTVEAAAEAHAAVRQPEAEPDVAETAPAASAVELDGVAAQSEQDTDATHEPPRSTGTDDTEHSWNAQHYSADIEEPGWISADDVAVFAPIWQEPPRAPAPPAASEAGPTELSGSRELDEALAALDALANPAHEGTVPADHGDEGRDDQADALPAGGLAAPPLVRPAWTRPSPPPQLVMRSPASRAYRRLRRIFPT